MKTAIITGCTNGIGKSGTFLLPKLGYGKLFLVARNLQKLQDVSKELLEKFPNTETVIKVVDLSDFEAVAKVSKELKAETKSTGIDLFLNNAGIGQGRKALNKQGFEFHLATNYLSQVILTEDLIENLNPDSTTIFTSSEAYKGASIDFEDINLEKSYSLFRAYGNSKAYQIMYAKILRNKFANDPRKLHFEAIHPGFVKTGFGRSDSNFLLKALLFLGSPFMLTSDHSAEHNLLAPIYPKNKEFVGKYDIWSDGKAMNVKANFVENESLEKLWKFTEKSVGEYVV